MPFDEEELLEVMIDDQSNQPYGNPVYINGGLNNRKIVAEMAFQRASPPQPTEGVGGYPPRLRVREGGEEFIDFRARSNINDDEINMMSKGAKILREVYANTKEFKGKDTQDRTNYIIGRKKFMDYDVLDTTTGLSQVFVNNERKEFIIGVRGVLPEYDAIDRFKFGQMALKTFGILKPDDVTDLGSYYKADRDSITDIVNFGKNEYPDYKIKLLGHSAGGGIAGDIAREYNIEAHLYNPASNLLEPKRNFDGYDPRNINIYTNSLDPVPMYIRKEQDYSPETFFNVFNKKNYFPLGHKLRNFIDEDNIHSVRKKSSFKLVEEVKNVPQKLIAFEEKLMLGEPETTNGLVSSYDDVGIFNNDNTTVFSVLNKQPENPFTPYRSVFDLIDSNNDNKISYNEYKSYYLKKGLSQKAIKKKFDKLDTNKDGSISSLEWRL